MWSSSYRKQTLQWEREGGTGVPTLYYFYSSIDTIQCSLSLSLCESTALSQWELTHHLKSDHEGIRYLCSSCEYKSRNKGKFNSHIQVKHNGGSQKFQKFPCSQCEYEASTPASLWTHVRWHTQPYWCWSCERTWWGPRSGRPCPRRCSPASAWWPSELDEAALLIEKLCRSQFPPIPFIVLLH